MYPRMTCEECGQELRLHDFIETDVEEQGPAIGLCPCGHMLGLSQALTTAYLVSMRQLAEEEREHPKFP